MPFQVLPDRKAFTLVEITMVILIIGILAAIGVPLILESTDAISFIGSRSEIVQGADMALNRFTREARRVKDDFSIVEAQPARFTFIDENSNQITYSLTGNAFVRNNYLLVEYVTSLAFTYYDESGNSITTPVVGSAAPTNIRSIGVQLVLQKNGPTFTVQTQVRPLNLRQLSYKLP